jgi:threonine aldolase
VLSITQATELGGVYRPDELQTIKQVADEYELKIHMDGARFANAVAALDVHPREITWQAGVDVLTFGGAKNGMAIGEAVVFFDTDLADEFDYRCKQAGQLASKMRYLSAPWYGMLQNDVLIKHAAHANLMARELADDLKTVAGVEIVHPVEANAVFVRMPEVLLKGLLDRGWYFYTFIGTGEARLMCSWQTTEEDVAELVSDLRDLAG